MRRGRALVLVLVLFLLVVLVGSVVAIFSMLGGSGPSVTEGSVLVVDIGGPLPEQPMAEQPMPGLGRRYLSVMEIDSSLRKAAVDERVERVLIRPYGMSAGFGKVQELRTIIETFKVDSEGKPVTCWMETAGNREYYLATACDEIWMAPEGFMLVNGLHLGVTFYKGTLDKLGVEAEFARAGRYKSAVEPLTSEHMSPAFREMMESLADSIYDDLVTAIADSRGLTEAEVRAIIDDPPLTSAGAARVGLIDGLLYEDQLDDLLAGRDVEPIALDLPAGAGLLATGDDDDSARLDPLRPMVRDVPVELPPEDPTEAAAQAEHDAALDKADELTGDDDDEPDVERISMSDYRLVSPASLGLGKGPKVAVLFCEGQITSGESNPGGALGGQSMGSDTIAGALRKIREDDSIEALVLRIDSPGGSGLASDVIWREVQLVNDKMPVVVSMGDYAASGGYYIAMGADAIVAQPGTLTGSIGVFGGKYNLGGLYEKIGLTTDSVKRGEMSDLFAADRSLGEDGHAKLSEFIDEFYGDFITKAAEGRDTTPEEVHRVAQGRVWTGAQAHAVGLVDELGSFRTALQLAKEKAGIDGEARLVIYPRQPTFWEMLLEGSGPGLLAPALDGWTTGGPLPDGASFRSAVAVLRAAPLFADGRPVLMAPYHIDVW
jgi:protease IV